MHKILGELSKPFDPSLVSWRVGSTTADKKKGIALAYLDARDVMERLDEVCGTGWQCRYSHVGERTCCEISINVDGAWLTRSNGAGDTDVEAEKGAFSDAFKRAAVLWGVGRYLYGLQSPWVELEPAGKSYKIATHEYPRLVKLLGVPPNVGATQEPTRTPKTETQDFNIDALKQELIRFGVDLKKVSDEDELAGLLHGYKQALDHAAFKLPEWYFGNVDKGGTKRGIQAAISDKQQEIRAKA